MNRLIRVASLGLLALALGTATFAQVSSQLPPDFLQHVKILHPRNVPAKNAHLDPSLLSPEGISGIDSIVNFTGLFNANGIGIDGTPQNLWQFSMVGHDPTLGGTTLINAPIFPVSLTLLDAAGGVAATYDVTPFITPTLLSPIFLATDFPGTPGQTQWTDAQFRSEFFHSMRKDWHTVLVPQLQPTVTMTLPFGTYVAEPNADGSCCKEVLVNENEFIALLFPPTFPVDNTTLIGAAELSGQMTTKTIATFLFPNTYLFENNNVKDCCVLGFHTFDLEPGIPANGNLNRAYMMNYSSWITPGLFRGGFQDVTALSHEMAELFNDPFVGFDGVHNITPWWLSGNQCQDLMEVGDVIESLPANVIAPTKNIFGTTYAIQNVASLQWFEFLQNPDSFNHAYSYPNKAALPDLSPFQNPGCPAP